MDFEPEITGTHRPQLPSRDPRLVVCATRPESITLAALFDAAHGWDCHVSSDVEGLRTMLLAESFDAVILSSEDCDEDLAADVRRLQPHASIVLAAPFADVGDVTRAMRFGATDFLVGSLGAEEVEQRMAMAVARSRECADRDRRVRRLESVVERIDEITEVGQDDSGLDVGTASASETDDRVAMRSEFRTLLRQELDVEDLLRTALEYLLVKTGPTNAAVFLAGGDGRFGLGAYVNYEHARATVEPMLQRLCDEACPRLAGEPGILRFDDAAEFIGDCDLGEDVDCDVEMIAVPCLHEGECLAVAFLFRNARESFDDRVASVLDDLRALLAEQLDRLIRIHNRLERAWPEDPSEEEGWDDLAA